MKYSFSLMALMSKGKWREEQSIPDVPLQQAVYKKLFLSVKTEKYFCSKSQAEEQRRLVVLGHQALTCDPCQTQLFPKQHQLHQMCHQHREMPSLPRGKEAAAPPYQTRINPFSCHLCQHDPNPQGACLPLCPPASPRSLLLGALLLSGSGSVDPGLASWVKDHPLRGKPWTPPPQLSL